MTAPKFHDHAPNAWTEDRVALLRKLWAEGLTAAAIASRLGGTTKNAVIGKADRLGLSGRQSGRTTLLTVEERRARKNKCGQERRARLRGATVAPAPIPSAPIKLNRPPTDGRVTVLHLSDSTCRWPHGHVGEPDFQFCGALPKPSSVYCEQHHDLAYQPPPERRPRQVGWRE